MMTIYVVDDEFFIIEKLKIMISQTDFDCQIVGSSMDGMTAFEEICALNPDVVITDIRMPGKSGLELIHDLQSAGLHSQFVIISGYKQFEYAQTALKFGVKDYLLKPIKQSDLESILTHIRQNIQGSKDTAATADGYVTKLHTLLLGNIINNKDLPQNAQDLKRDFAVAFDGDCFNFALVQMDGTLSGEQYEFLEHSLKMIVYEIFSPHCRVVIARRNQSQIVILLMFRKDASPRIRQEYFALLKQTQSYVSQYGKYFVTIGVGSPKTDVALLRDSYLEAVNAVRSRIQYGKSHVLFPPPPEATEALLDLVLGSNERSIITKYIETTDFDSLQQQIRGMFVKTSQMHSGYSLVYFSLCQTLFSMFWNVVPVSSTDLAPEESAFHSALEQCSSVEELHSTLLRHTTEAYKKQYDINSFSTNAAISVAKRFIHEHYAEKITLAQIAKLVYLTPVYFSMLFKRETGSNFNNYVQEYRIVISKRLLQQIDLPIADVAESVGIPDTSYFSRIFKKAVGVSPTEYRRIHAASGAAENGDL